MVRRRSWPGVPGLADLGRLGHRPPVDVALRQERRGASRPGVLVVLLDAVLARALAVDEAQEVGRQRRVRAAAGLRVDALGLRLQRQAR